MKCEVCHGKRILNGMLCRECDGSGEFACCSGEIAQCSPEMKSVFAQDVPNQIESFDEFNENVIQEKADEILRCLKNDALFAKNSDDLSIEFSDAIEAMQLAGNYTQVREQWLTLQALIRIITRKEFERVGS